METSTWYVIRQRLAWIKMQERGVPVTQVCLHYGISRKTFYKWLRRYQEGGRDFHALKDRSRRPHSLILGLFPRAAVERLLALWRITHYGPRRLAYYLSQEGYDLSVFGAYRVLQRAGLVKKRRSRPRKKPQSYAMLAPGQRAYWEPYNPLAVRKLAGQRYSTLWGYQRKAKGCQSCMMETERVWPLLAWCYPRQMPAVVFGISYTMSI